MAARPPPAWGRPADLEAAGRADRRGRDDLAAAAVRRRGVSAAHRSRRGGWGVGVRAAGGRRRRSRTAPRVALARARTEHAGRSACNMALTSRFGMVAMSEKDAMLAQKLGQLQPFIAVFPQECMGQLASFGPA
jgi:hypothetical protein